VGLARSMGCDAVRVERPQDLGQTLTTALQSPVPYLVDVAVV
jgi:thiamine pyrophosphate-dependent acetolactate synthase large subunit-like protein